MLSLVYVVKSRSVKGTHSIDSTLYTKKIDCDDFTRKFSFQEEI